MIKKIKFLSKKGSSAEVDELDTQLKLLGAVDLHILSANHLKLKLRKHYLLKKGGMPSDVEAAIGGGQTVKASGSSATPDVIAKVENRLCSAKNVAEGVKGIVSWCLAEPGSSLNLEKMKEKKNKKNPKPESDDESASEGDDEREDDVPNAVGELDSDDEVVVEEKAADAAGWESGDLEGEGSDEEDEESGAEAEGGWESGSVGGEEGAGGDAWIASASDSDAPDYAALANLKGGAGSDWSSGSEGDSDTGSDSGFGSDSSSSSVAVERPPAKKAKAEAPKKAEKPAKAEKKPEKKAAKGEKPKPDGSSMFLPSLAAGFTAGDSDSDPDMDYDPDGVIGTKAAPRKNRRGQRARQA